MRNGSPELPADITLFAALCGYLRLASFDVELQLAGASKMDACGGLRLTSVTSK
jgi:hypothetical protein